MHQIGLHLLRLIETRPAFGFSIAIPMLVPVNPIGICNCCPDMMENGSALEKNGFFAFVMVMIKIVFDNSSVLSD
jgi:hypothetical protein